MFETEADAKKYAKDNGIKTGWFRQSKIVGNKDGTWSIDNKSKGSSISNDKEFGILEGALVTDYQRNNTDAAQYGGLERYRAWQSNPNYNEGESKWDRVFRLMGNSHNEIAHDFGGGGYNLFGGYGRAAKVGNLVKIGMIEDDVMIFSSNVGNETVEGITNFMVKDGKLFLNELHLQGSSAGNIGREALWKMARDLGKQYNVSEVIIQGGRRTTGKYKGQVPSPISIKVN